MKNIIRKELRDVALLSVIKIIVMGIIAIGIIEKGAPWKITKDCFAAELEEEDKDLSVLEEQIIEVSQGQKQNLIKQKLPASLIDCHAQTGSITCRKPVPQDKEKVRSAAPLKTSLRKRY